MSSLVKAFRYPIALDVALGRLAVETDYPAHVEQLIKQVLLTSVGERVNRPDFGCGLRNMVFAPNSVANAQLLQVTVFQSLTRWLGNIIRVDRVLVTAVDEKLSAKIAYLVYSRGTRNVLDLEVSL